ncbi:MAG: HAD hydrolase-like protein [bacterium]|nr:HAD hydrolase-like protein [bacterium]
MFRTRSTVLFDLDGTLVDSAADLTAAVNHVLEEDSLAALDGEEILQMVGDGAPALLRRAYRRHAAELPADTFERFGAHYAAHCLDATRPYPGIVELLRQLADERRGVAVVTNKPTPLAERMVDGLGLGPFVQAVVGPELAARRKPAPEHVLVALEHLGKTPAEAVMVGDGTTDVLAGRGAATATIAVLWGYRSRDELAASGPDRFVATVPELVELLVGR